MKLVTAALILITATVPALAQAPAKPSAAPPETPEARTCDLELSRERASHTVDVKDAFSMMDQLRDAQSRVEDLKKQVADLTPKAPTGEAPTAPAATEK